jgi:hypothetical protein
MWMSPVGATPGQRCPLDFDPFGKLMGSSSRLLDITRIEAPITGNMCGIQGAHMCRYGRGDSSTDTPLRSAEERVLLKDLP